MFAQAKGVLIIVCVLLCTLTLMGGRSNVPPAAGPGAGQAPAVTVESVPVLVEAFVVEVNLPALARLGVSPIGEEPHAASVADILKCLDTGQARVIAGAKAASRQGNTTVRATRTTYVKRETGTTPKTTYTYSPYESGAKFSVSTGAASNTARGAAMLVQFNFEHSLFMEKGQALDVPPDTANWEWSGAVGLQPGKPEIAAATQDGETAVFLLLTAHVRGQ